MSLIDLASPTAERLLGLCRVDTADATTPIGNDQRRLLLELAALVGITVPPGGSDGLLTVADATYYLARWAETEHNMTIIDLDAAPPADAGLSLHGVAIEAPTGWHLGALAQLVADPRVSSRWTHHGRHVEPERVLSDMLSRSIQFSCVTVPLDDESAERRVIGFVSVFDVEPSAQHAQLGVISDPAYWGRPEPAIGMVLGLAHAFRSDPLNKVYLSVPGFNLDLLPSLAGPMFECEGILADHVRWGGALHAMHLLSITRDRFVGAVADFGGVSLVERIGMSWSLGDDGA